MRGKMTENPINNIVGKHLVAALSNVSLTIGPILIISIIRCLRFGLISTSISKNKKIFLEIYREMT